MADILNGVEDRAQHATLVIAEDRFEKRVAQTEAKLETKIVQIEAKLESKIAQTEARLIRWMFLFWVGQLGSITAILFVFFRS